MSRNLFAAQSLDSVQLVMTRNQLFNDLFLQTLDKRDYLALFGLRYLELRQSCGGMPEEYVPVALAYTHASMAQQHVPAAIVCRSARARAEEVYKELLFAHDAVFSTMCPKATELRIGREARQQIIHRRCNRVISANVLVKGLLAVAHSVLL